MCTPHNHHIFTPIAILGTIDAIEDIDRHISMATDEPLETTYPFQHISVVIQSGNVICFMSTFDNE